MSDEERKARAREKARLRKQRFDARMKSTAGSTEGAQQPRRACVIYLSEDARAVLQRNRLKRRVMGQPPMLDSQLVEELLLAHEERSMKNSPEVTLQINGELTSSSVDKLVVAYQAEIKKLKLERIKSFAAEARIEQLEDEEREAALTELSGIEEYLLSLHGVAMSLRGHYLVARLKNTFTSASDDVMVTQQIGRELTEYLQFLVDLADS